MEALAKRSASTLPDLTIWAIYPPDEAPEPVPGQSLPSPEPEPTPDHYALAGIGREDAKYRGYWRPEGERG